MTRSPSRAYKNNGFKVGQKHKPETIEKMKAAQKARLARLRAERAKPEDQADDA